jgi:GT2 family glycosyltransferase
MTLNCIRRILESDSKNFTGEIFLVDGGSTDGTVSAISEEYPDLNIEARQGLYWNRGMIAAWENAVATGVLYDGYLLLNDDVLLHKGALSELVFIVSASHGYKLAVGYTTSPVSGLVTYGGLKRKRGFSRIAFEKTSDNKDQIVSMNGNCVLISKRIYDSLGLLDSRYQHSFGDIDYGLRAIKAGYDIQISSKPVAFMESNNTAYSETKKLNPVELFSVMRDPKGVPLWEWLHFTRTHAGFIWPLNFLYRYLKMLRWNQ